MTATDTDTAQAVRYLAAEAVADAVITEARVGLSLSGGIDSSSIYALALPARPVPCFTGYYQGARYDERFYARLLDPDEHHEILITPDDFVTHFDDMVRAAQPPYQGPGTFGQYMVARYAHDHVDVMLSGEGGDELFGGYARLLIVAGERRPDGYDHYVLPDGYPSELAEALAWDLARLPDLLAVDTLMLGAFGIEAVAPFTHPSVVDYVTALPAELRVGKRLLREAMRGLVPDIILDRTDKRGFPAPLVEWANDDTDVAALVHDRIGYLPDPDQPWARDWWLELVTQSARLLDL